MESYFVLDKGGTAPRLEKVHEIPFGGSGGMIRRAT